MKPAFRLAPRLMRRGSGSDVFVWTLKFAVDAGGERTTQFGSALTALSLIWRNTASGWVTGPDIVTRPRSVLPPTAGEGLSVTDAICASRMLRVAFDGQLFPPRANAAGHSAHTAMATQPSRLAMLENLMN